MPPPRTLRVIDPAPVVATLGDKLDAIAAKLDRLIAILDAPDVETIPHFGVQKVQTTGTAVILGNAPINAVVVQALHGNAGTVTVGDGSVGQTVGFELSAGQAVGVIVDNLFRLSVNGTAGDGVSWLGT